MSVESNYSNYMDPGGSHLLFNDGSSIGAPSSSFVLQLLEFGFPHYKKSFLEVGYSSLAKSSTWVHGFWPSWADAPAASQKCWVGVEMQQSCHCKLEKVKSNQRLYLPCHQNSVGAHCTASEVQGNMRQCPQLMRSPKTHLCELWEEKKNNLAYPEVMPRDDAGFE